MDLPVGHTMPPYQYPNGLNPRRVVPEKAVLDLMHMLATHHGGDTPQVDVVQGLTLRGTLV